MDVDAARAHSGLMWRELPQDKRAARAIVRAGRRARPANQRAVDAAALAGHLRSVIAGMPTGCAAAYTALPTEPPTDDLIRSLDRAGWAVMLPVLLSDNDLSWQVDGQDAGTDHIGRADLLIVPALAVDRRGHRLGQGGGSYDRALLRRPPGAFTIAIVYDDELAQLLPSEPHDLQVDAVITPHAGLAHLRH